MLGARSRDEAHLFLPVVAFVAAGRGLALEAVPGLLAGAGFSIARSSSKCRGTVGGARVVQNAG